MSYSLVDVQGGLRWGGEVDKKLKWNWSIEGDSGDFQVILLDLEDSRVQLVSTRLSCTDKDLPTF
jgi:hypothetical protein